jgi:catechol 2,3-dioxygenase-like lactoylglutathione lyase family enzyme
VLLVIAATFLVCVSVGAQSWVVAAIGVAILAAGVAFYVVSALNSREFAYIPGTAHVVSCSPPPASSSHGRIELHLVVHTPGQDDVAVKIRETGVPIAKWPDAGSTLPILVAVGDPRRVRVLWDRVRTHSEQAARDEEYEDQQYPADAIPEALLDDILDEDEHDYDEPPLVNLEPGAKVIEFDVHDPAQFRIEPVYASWDDGLDEGPQESPGIQLDPHTALAQETELSPETQFAGSTGDPDNPEPPPPASRRRPSPRPSPRPRRGDNPGPRSDPSDGPVSGVTTLPHQPDPDEHDAWKPPSPAPVPHNATAEVPEPPMAATTAPPALRVRHLTAPDPAVPGIPPSHAAADDPEVSDAYLSATPPGERVGGAAVTLFVANLGRSVAFYRDVLGFRQIDMGIGKAVLEAGDGRIVLRRVVDMAPVDRRLVHLLLEVPDVQAAYDELLLQGVEFVHRPRVVSRDDQLELWSAAFRDPDGHGIALTKWEVREPD